MNDEVVIEAENGNYIGKLDSIEVDEDIEDGLVISREVQIEIKGPLFEASNLPPFMERKDDNPSDK